MLAACGRLATFGNHGENIKKIIVQTSAHFPRKSIQNFLYPEQIDSKQNPGRKVKQSRRCAGDGNI